jgi:hypothetical protein
MGWCILFVAWLIIDAYTLNSRSRKFRDFCRLNGSSEEAEDFFYPADRENALLVRELASEYERYKAKFGGKQDFSEIDLRVTSIFRLEDGEWKLAHRHADSLAEVKATETVIKESKCVGSRCYF